MLLVFANASNKMLSPDASPIFSSPFLNISITSFNVPNHTAAHIVVYSDIFISYFNFHASFLFLKIFKI